MSMTPNFARYCAQKFKDDPIYIGFGHLQTTEADPQALRAENGFVRAAAVDFVKSDPDGTESHPPLGSFDVSGSPTGILRVRGVLDFEEALGNDIAEIGIYIGGELKSDTPRGKRFLAADDFQTRPLLIAVEQGERILRNRPARIEMNFILNF